MPQALFCSCWLPFLESWARILPGAVSLTNWGTLGNAGNIGDRLQNAYGLYENVQCNILMVDYRGYGKSDSVTPDEAGLINDAVACVDYLWKRGIH